MSDEKKKFLIQRCSYTFIGVLTIIPIVLLTIGQMQINSNEKNQFLLHLLLFVHSGFVICSIISTGIFTRVTDALLTSFMIVYLTMFTGVDFYLRYTWENFRGKKDFSLITFRMSFVLIMLMVILPWTNLLVYSARKTEKNCSRNRIFSSLLNLDWILMISFFILNIRKPWLFLAIGIPWIILWFILGKLLANDKCRHWIIWMIFYIFSLVELFYLVYITYSTKLEYDLFIQSNEISSYCFLLVTFLSGSSNILIHFLLMIISASIARS